MFAFWQNDRIKHDPAALDELLDRLPFNDNVSPIGHIGGGEYLASQREKTEKYLSLSGRLGLDNGETLDFINSINGQKRGESACLL
jgi:hypothetical protein